MPLLPNLNFTKRQWITLLIMALADFCNAICVSLQAPFYPQEAEKKGSTATEYGLVFGIFELVVFIISPIYGQYLNRIGPKLLFNGGMFSTGVSAVLFGLLDKVPGHKLFISLSFIIRIVEALGNAGFLTASFAIIAKEFPNNIGTTFASLETCFGLGLIVGPMVGGALYSLGGYFLPFVVLGCTLFSTAIITLCVLPKHPKETDSTTVGPSMKSILVIPGVLVCSLSISATSASIGFLSATLEPHLRQFNLSPVVLGMIFIINGGIYAITAPIWGWMVDKVMNPKVASLLGSIFIVIAFCTLGPASFIPMETTLTNVILGLILHGVGISAILVSGFTDALRTSIKKGLPDNIETYGLISGLWTSTFALGAFIGPSVSGALYDSIGFRSATIFIICLHSLVALITVFFIFCDKGNHPNPYKELSPSDSLLRKNSENGRLIQNNSLRSVNKSRTSFSSVGSSIICDQPQARSCGMHNLLVCNGYTGTGKQWSSSCEANSPHSNETTRYYGSVDCIRNNVSSAVGLQESVA